MRSIFVRPVTAAVTLALMAGFSVRPAAAQERVTIPRDTVVQAELDGRLSSQSAREGDRFTANLAPADRSGFPAGTRFQGTLTEVQRATNDSPGILDMRVRTALLPDGTQVAMDGRLASLEAKNVRRTADGRLEANTRSGGRSFDAKWIGYGAGAGAVLAVLTSGNLLRSALIGGLGGAIYGYIRSQGGDRSAQQFRDVELASGTPFGVRLNQSVAFRSDIHDPYSASDFPTDPQDEFGDW
jgi:hypothetical protein